MAVGAQTCCSGGVPLAGNLGLPATGAGTLQMGLSYDLNRLRRLYTGSERLDDGSRTRNTQTVLLEASYSFSDRFALDVLLPYIRQERIISRATTTTDVTSGIGDAVALLRYHWLAPDLGRSWQGSSGLGVKLPNGAADRRSDNDIAFNADLQPGSGAWDMIFWNRVAHQLRFRPSLSVYLTGVHRRRGTNDDYLPITNSVTGERQSQTYRFGTETQLTLGLSDQVILLDRIANPGLAILYRHAEADRTNGAETPSTGGTFYFLQPSLGINLTDRLSWQFAADLPMRTRVVGTQVAPSLRLNTGLLLRLGTNKSPSSNTYDRGQ